MKRSHKRVNPYIFPKGKDGSKPKEHVTGECERRGQRAHREAVAQSCLLRNASAQTKDQKPVKYKSKSLGNALKIYWCVILCNSSNRKPFIPFYTV